MSTIPTEDSRGKTKNTITTEDGTQIYFKDRGEGRPVVFSHGWPLNADAWENQMVFFAQNGYRATAHDRRGHGRSRPDRADRRLGVSVVGDRRGRNAKGLRRDAARPARHAQGPAQRRPAGVPQVVSMRAAGSRTMYSREG